MAAARGELDQARDEARIAIMETRIAQSDQITRSVKRRVDAMTESIIETVVEGAEAAEALSSRLDELGRRIDELAATAAMAELQAMAKIGALERLGQIERRVQQGRNALVVAEK